ncbi:hypothetical protein CDD81_4901 [Ophiocordyceps australis]|uniref:Uncharacterized protein n=1 Tax=Ophiocordyceps australis TaxID=1399860 RepID=A0A2C5YB13_9HYPO|nr:hypothetical protein CDD81_4901 [Ophiocordyceps australis]
MQLTQTPLQQIADQLGCSADVPLAVASTNHISASLDVYALDAARGSLAAYNVPAASMPRSTAEPPASNYHYFLIASSPVPRERTACHHQPTLDWTLAWGFD